MAPRRPGSVRSMMLASWLRGDLTAAGGHFVPGVADIGPLEQ